MIPQNARTGIATAFGIAAAIIAALAAGKLLGVQVPIRGTTMELAAVAIALALARNI